MRGKSIEKRRKKLSIHKAVKRKYEKQKKKLARNTHTHTQKRKNAKKNTHL